MPNPGYFDMQMGMVFTEVRKHPRVIKILIPGLYFAETEVLSGRGKGKPLRVFNKYLADEKQWVYERTER